MTDLMPVQWDFLIVVAAICLMMFIVPLTLVAIKHAIRWLWKRVRQ